MVNYIKRLFSLEEAPPVTESDVIVLQKNRKPKGSSGVENYSGYPREEYLGQHQGRQRADLYDKMRRSDYIIQMCLGAIRHPIVSANWEIEKYCDPRIEAKKKEMEALKKKQPPTLPGQEPTAVPPVKPAKPSKLQLLAELAPVEGDVEPVEPAEIEPIEPESIDPEAAGAWAEEDAKMIECLLFELMEKTFDQYLIEALVMLVYGHSVFEVVDKAPIVHPIHKVVHGIDFRWISPRTIERWNLDPETEKVTTITQQAFGDLGKTTDIDGQFLQILSFQREGANYEGISALRGCYGPWYRKQEYTKLNAIGIEKFAIPTPLVKIPANSQNTVDYQNLVALLQNYVNHEKQYITYPEGYEFELNTNTYDPEKVEASIDKEDTRIVKAFMANFLNLDTAGSGSYALSNDLSDFFLGGIEHIAKIICNSFNKEIIPRLVQINRGPRDGYPKMKVSGISDKLGQEFATMMDLMVKNKVIKPDDKLEVHVRRRMGLPEASLEGQRDASPPGAQIDPATGLPIAPAPGKEAEGGGKPPGSKPKPAPGKPPAPAIPPEPKETAVERLAEMIRKTRRNS